MTQNTITSVFDCCSMMTKGFKVGCCLGREHNWSHEQCFKPSHISCITDSQPNLTSQLWNRTENEDKHLFMFALVCSSVSVLLHLVGNAFSIVCISMSVVHILVHALSYCACVCWKVHVHVYTLYTCCACVLCATCLNFWRGTGHNSNNLCKQFTCTCVCFVAVLLFYCSNIVGTQCVLCMCYTSSVTSTGMSADHVIACVQYCMWLGLFWFDNIKCWWRGNPLLVLDFVHNNWNVLLSYM